MEKSITFVANKTGQFINELVIEASFNWRLRDIRVEQRMGNPSITEVYVGNDLFGRVEYKITNNKLIVTKEIIGL